MGVTVSPVSVVHSIITDAVITRPRRRDPESISNLA
jgi:hypothetical protein